MRHRITHLSLAALAAMPASQVHAQAPAPAPSPAEDAPADDRLTDIVVTAQRRSENLQSVPIAVTAFTAGQLGQAGIQSTQDLSVATPGLSIGSAAGYIKPRIRGIGTSGAGAGIENPVAVYVDGVYYASAPASLFSFSGVERVEVLKGPQGTLFGRNATGGLIQVVTRDPGTRPQANIDLGYANYGTITADAYVAGPLGDQLGASLALHSSHQKEGYGINFANGRDVNRTDRDIGVRGKLVGEFGDLKLSASGDYNSMAGTYQAGRLPVNERSAFGGSPSDRVWDINSDVQPLSRFSGGGGSLRAELPLGAAKVVSISAYRKSDYRTVFDYDDTAVPFAGIEINQSDRQFSQELQLLSDGGSPISWVVGGYYFDARSEFDPVIVSFLEAGQAVNGGLRNTTIFGVQKTDSLSAFGQVTVPLGERTNLTGGLRYTSEKRTLDGDQTLSLVGIGTVPAASVDGLSKRFKKLTWRLSLDHKLTDGVLAYASYNRGFKSGGFNAQILTDPPYQPEVLDAYEGGVKADLLDRRLRVNIAGFYYDYANIQVPIFLAGGNSGIRNGAKAEVYGVDLDLVGVVSDAFRVNAGFSWLHDRFKSYPGATFNQPVASGGSIPSLGDASGNRIPITPDWTLNVGGTYTLRLASGAKVDLDANYFHSDGYLTEADNFRRQKPYDTVNASLTWTDADDRLRVSLWGRNLTNEAIALQIVANPFSSNSIYQPPRTYGGTVGVKF